VLQNKPPSRAIFMVILVRLARLSKGKAERETTYVESADVVHIVKAEKLVVGL
jgi:hypothetical protein